MSSKFRSRLGDDLERLIRAIGDCKSKSEEDRILYRSIEATKAALKDGKSQSKDLMIKLLYFEMLGHDASFGHFLAVQGCGSSQLQTKMVAYLSVSQFLDSEDKLILLLVNTWRSDLQSDNFLIVCAALTCVCKLVNVDAVGALVPQILSLITHPKEVVRKKAVMALHKLFLLDPRSEGPLAGVDMDRHLRQSLCDKDPSVMAATTCALYEMVKANAAPFRNLIPSLISILKQVCEHRLNKSYEYHHVPAPFIQTRILKILGQLGAGDKPSTENMRNILLTVLRQSNMRNTIGHAVLYECVRTITTVSPDPQLLEAAARTITGFLKPDNSHNLKYMGIDTLGGIVRINPKQAQDHQAAVMDCLEDPDDTLKLKTLNLLVKMTKPNNVEIVVEKLIAFLGSCPDEHIQRDICSRVSELSERYAPDTQWYIETMVEMFLVAGEAVDPKVSHSLMRLIAEQETDVHKKAVQVFLKALEEPKLPEVLLQVICWVLGEYGCLTRSPEDVMDSVCGLIHLNNCTESLKGFLLTAVSKVCAQSGCSLTPDAEEFIRKAASSKSTELQQRALELQAMMSARQLMSMVLPKDASCEDLEGDMPAIESVSFLQGYVDQALQNGAAPYIAEDHRHGAGTAGPAEAVDVGSLKYEAYSTPTPPDVGGGAVSNLDMSVDPGSIFPPAPLAAASTGPQLSLNPTKTRRWGPATFAPSESHMSQPPPAAEAPPVEAPTSEFDSLGLTSDSVHEELSDRDRLKASLFGDSKSTRTSRFRNNGSVAPPKASVIPTAAAAAPAASSRPAATSAGGDFDLLDMGDPGPAPAPSSSTADPFSGVDLLGGLEAGPAPTTSTTEEKRPAIDLDALYGNTPTPSGVGSFMQTHQPQFPAPQMAMGGNPGMMNLMGGNMMGGGMGVAQPQGNVMGGASVQPGGGADPSQGLGFGMGMVSGGLAPSNPVSDPIGGVEGIKLGKQVKKEDPFGDLLG
ncbi:hypothetical protein BSKO_00230 [Bryopsis sp. KO-2023]|nr:hypothetical protein BSKO_00230 [Bryopsis sp. KO-2023]